MIKFIQNDSQQITLLCVSLSFAYCYHLVSVISSCVSQSDSNKRLNWIFNFDSIITSWDLKQLKTKLIKKILLVTRVSIKFHFFIFETEKSLNWVSLKRIRIYFENNLMNSFCVPSSSQIIIHCMPLNGITDNFINQSMESNITRMFSPKLLFHA